MRNLPLLTTVHTVKSKGKILQNFVAFSEYMNFIGTAAEDLTANSEWLLKRLPRLPCFAGYYPQISNALRFACQYENDPLGKFTHCEKTTKLKNISPFFEIT